MAPFGDRYTVTFPDRSTTTHVDHRELTGAIAGLDNGTWKVVHYLYPGDNAQHFLAANRKHLGCEVALATVTKR